MGTGASARTARRRGRPWRWLPIAVLAACVGRPEPLRPDATVDAVLTLLGNGDLEAATAVAAEGRQRWPGHGGIAVCSATIADLSWRDDLAIAEWRAVITSGDHGGWSPAAALGRLGEQLFAAGRYGEALLPLLAGQVGEHAQRRRALLAVARELPFRRTQVGPLATEHPVLAGELPEFECSLGELRRVFAVDTGSSLTTVASSVAAAARVRVLADVGDVPDGTGRPVPARLGVLDAFAVGDIWLGSVPVLVVDDERLRMRDMFAGPQRAPAGVLGLDVLAQFRMTLDPQRQSLLLELPRGLPEATSVPSVRVAGRCVVPVAIEGRKLWFVLDTGASHSSIAPSGLAELPGGSQRAVPGFRRVRSAAGGTVSVREVQNLILRVADTRFAGVDLPVIERSTQAPFPVHGVLGIDLLRQCRLLFDRGRARLEPAR